MRALRFVAGLALGWAASAVLLTAGKALLRGAWPDYALAEPEKAYTLAMLLARLGVASVIIAGAAGVATLVAGDRRAAWTVGGLILLLSLPPHLYHVWDDYPAWYHFTYLLSILPIAVYSGRAIRRLWPGVFPENAAP